jgi:hypothetical protein
METLHVLSKQSRQSLAMQNMIASYRLRVYRKRGEWLHQNIENGEDRRSESQSHRVTLKDVGITTQESHILQRIASIPDDAFRNHIVATWLDTMAMLEILKGLLRLIEHMGNSEPEAQTGP